MYHGPVKPTAVTDCLAVQRLLCQITPKENAKLACASPVSLQIIPSLGGSIEIPFGLPIVMSYCAPLPILGIVASLSLATNPRVSKSIAGVCRLY